MDVLKLSDVPSLLEIIEKLFKQKKKKGDYSRDLDDDTIHYSNRKTGEFIIYTVKTEPQGIYVIEMVEAKNGTTSCAFSVYRADLEKKAGEIVWVSMPFQDGLGSNATAKASQFAHKLKYCGNLEEEISCLARRME